MSWSYRSDRSDEVYTQSPGPAVVAGQTVTDAQGNAGISPKSYPADGAIDVRSHTAVLTKGSAGAYTLAAPTADGIQLVITSNTLFAHVVTATSLLANGTALKTTATYAAFRGANMYLQSFGGVWHVIGQNGVTLT